MLWCICRCSIHAMTYLVSDSNYRTILAYRLEGFYCANKICPENGIIYWRCITLRRSMLQESIRIRQVLTCHEPSSWWSIFNGKSSLYLLSSVVTLLYFISRTRSSFGHVSFISHRITIQWNVNKMSCTTFSTWILVQTIYTGCFLKTVNFQLP